MIRATAIVPAAGVSARFGTDKLSQDLGGRPLLVRTVEALSRRPEVKQIIVAGPPASIDQFKERFGPVLGFHGAEIVGGGETDRWETVALAIASVAEDATHILVHDAARPCIGDALLDRLFEAAATLDAVIPGVPIASTIKQVDSNTPCDVAQGDALADSILGADTAPGIEACPIVQTIPRSNLVLAQTPQIFRREVLIGAYAAGGLEGTTDDASVVERAGHTVHVVAGDPLNIKITRGADLRLASAIMRDMQSN